jgi:hypothetical protein
MFIATFFLEDFSLFGCFLAIARSQYPCPKFDDLDLSIELQYRVQQYTCSPYTML